MEELRSLVTRGQGGDLDAYGQVVRRFQDMAFGYAYSILGDFHRAEDAAQEAFIQAYRDLPALREPAAFPGWLRRIVFKQCDRLTRRKRVPTTALHSARTIESGGAGPAENAERREMADRVLDAVRSLPEKERTVTTLFYIDGYSQKDIAEFLEVPVTTVNNRLHASRKRLKERVIHVVADTLKANLPDREFQQRVKARLIAECYGLERAEGWRWAPAEPLHVASFRHEGQAFVVRIYSPDTEGARLDFNAAFVGRLRELGLGGETVIPTSAGQPYAALSNGEAATLLAIDEGARLEVPFSVDEAHEWGGFAARLHAAIEGSQPEQPVAALLVADSPGETLRQALGHASGHPSSRRILERLGPIVVSDCQAALEALPAQTIHGELDPCNLLRTADGMKAVDARSNGVGPRAIDMATAFRWMPWGHEPERAQRLWQAWLSGYRELRQPSEAELSALPALGSLQHAFWLNVEVIEGTAEGAPQDEVRWYLEDHCRAIEALMARR